MVVPKYDRTSRKIVSTQAGPGTAETIYVDEYGCRWQTTFSAVSDETCPPLTGRIEGGYILTGKR